MCCIFCIQIYHAKWKSHGSKLWQAAVFGAVFQVLHQQMNDYQLIQSLSTFLNFIQLIKDKFVY